MMRDSSPTRVVSGAPLGARRGVTRTRTNVLPHCGSPEPGAEVLMFPLPVIGRSVPALSFWQLQEYFVGPDLRLGESGFLQK